VSVPPPVGVDLDVGDELELDIGPVAHGGVCVARADGRVVFVRYALPGERAVVRVTEARPGSFCRGEAIRVVRADPRRVVPPCAHFGPGGCGGCDFQHARADLQRELKAAVVREQLRRLAGIDMPVIVESLPGDGFGWRSRVRWAVGRSVPGTGISEYDAVLGPRRYRSHEVVPISAARPCLIAAPGLTEAADALDLPPSADEVVLTRRAGADPAVAYLSGGRRVAGSSVDRADSDYGATILTERAYDRSFSVADTGFWQAHESAATVLCGAVDDALAHVDLWGGAAWDLYGGVGLFAAMLADLVGPEGSVLSVESDRAASDLAATNLADLPQARTVSTRVDRFLRSAADEAPGRVGAVVLDPPRSGAGEAVCRGIARRWPTVIVYVACDPAALARDAATLAGVGYRLAALRAFDAFPQTHHVECVASFTAV